MTFNSLLTHAYSLRAPQEFHEPKRLRLDSHDIAGNQLQAMSGVKMGNRLIAFVTCTPLTV